MPRVFELDLELVDASSRTWRRVRVPGNLALADLHDIIQIVFDWHDIHLHLFEVGQDEYGPPADDEPEDEEDEATRQADDANISVAEALEHGNGRFHYIYDFAAEWRVQITAATEMRAAEPPPIACVGGDGAAPSERSGPGSESGSARDVSTEPSLFDLDVTNAFLEAALAGAMTPPTEAVFATPDERLRGDVTLLALLLGSWEEPDGSLAAWKALPAETLEALTRAGLIATSAARASVALTDEGVRRARLLRERVAACL